MSPSSTQQWTRRMRYSDQRIRVSDAERSSVAELLGRHYADGRLDQAEFDERISQTMAAKTRGDLTGLFDDLPDPDSAAGAGPNLPGGSAALYRPRRRGGLIRSALLLILLLICADIAWHTFTSVFFIGPMIWACVILVLLLLLTRAGHRHER